MDILDAVGGVLGSVVSGGVTGILGVVVQRIADFKNKQLDLKGKELDIQLAEKNNAHEREMRKIDAEIVAQEHAARTQIALTEATAKTDVAETKAFASSFNEPIRYSEKVQPNSGQGWMLVILDFIRGTVRPGLTIYLSILTTLVYVKASAQMDRALDGIQYFKVLESIIDTIMYLNTTCVLWWFGTRNRGKPPKS
jgi:hypothetical protein